MIENVKLLVNRGSLRGTWLTPVHPSGAVDVRAVSVSRSLAAAVRPAVASDCCVLS